MHVTTRIRHKQRAPYRSAPLGGQDTDEGLYVGLSSFVGLSRQYLTLHHRKTGERLYLLISRKEKVQYFIVCVRTDIVLAMSSRALSKVTVITGRVRFPYIKFLSTSPRSRLRLRLKQRKSLQQRSQFVWPLVSMEGLMGALRRCGRLKYCPKPSQMLVIFKLCRWNTKRPTR